MYLENKRTNSIGLTLFLTFLILAPQLWAELDDEENTPGARIAIIIDDMGYRRVEGNAALALPGALTYSILPFTHSARYFAQQADRHGREVLLHLPMESLAGDKLGPGGLTTDMTRQELVELVSESLKAVPHIKGVNNHMGSLFTTNYDAMSAVMSTIERQGPQLFFVDSVTTSYSIVPRAARRHGIAVLSRNVFLDNVLTKSAIRIQFQRLTAIARKYGKAIAIGHPHPETIGVLREELSSLSTHGVVLVPVSELFGTTPSSQRQTD